ncbi:hypothetical protein [Longispora albida]|uniref:hypothetical protein n=1 Tax=Longispora albida TaxID=203523 RepID=UPI000378E883|nr:hypothetical protein [Longispora albida]
MLNAFKARWLAWPLLALALTGCLGTCCCWNWIGPSPGLAAEDLSGDWDGPFGGTLNLRTDGTYTMRDVVLCGESGRERGGSPVSREGTWRLAEPAFLTPTQAVYFDESELGTSYAATSDDNLFYYVGDRDSVDLCHFTRPG